MMQLEKFEDTKSYRFKYKVQDQNAIFLHQCCSPSYLKSWMLGVELDINPTICIDVPAPNRKSEHAVIYLCVMGHF
jgi:hypothetical protein